MDSRLIKLGYFSDVVESGSGILECFRVSGHKPPIEIAVSLCAESKSRRVNMRVWSA